MKDSVGSSTCSKTREKRRGSYLESSVVEGGQDGDCGVNVLELSQQNVVVVGVHVGVDPKEERRLKLVKTRVS